MDKKIVLALGIITTIAVVIRVYMLSAVPVGFHGDEASIGYNAYSLLKTGRDQNNNLFPLAIDQFGDYRPAGYHYLAIPFIAIFGLTEFAVRLPAALLGALTVIPMYFLAYNFFRLRSQALLCALLLAISPWHVALSRSTSESIIALFLVLLGMNVLLSGRVGSAFILFAFSFFFYHSARLFVPLLLLYFVITKRVRVFYAFVATAIAVAILFVTSGLGRAGQVSVFKSPGDMQQLRQQTSEDRKFSPLVVRALHNKVTYYISAVAKNYFLHFDPDFLFLEGGQPVRYKVPWTGVLYLADMVFLGFGFSIGAKLLRIPLGWLLLAPIPAAFTFGELPSVQRALFMLPALLLILSYGMHVALAKRRLLTYAVILVYVYQVVVFGHNYFYHSFTHEPWYRNAAQKELVNIVEGYATQGRRVVMTSQNDNNLIFYLFYRGFNPREFQRIGSPRDRDNLSFGNMTFTYKHCPLEGTDQNDAVGEVGVLYINRGECKIPKNSKLIKDIALPDSSIAFRVLELIN